MLEARAGKSTFANEGQRVVKGHRLMPSARDYFDPSERNHAELMKAVRAGKLEVFVERD